MLIFHVAAQLFECSIATGADTGGDSLFQLGSRSLQRPLFVAESFSIQPLSFKLALSFKARAFFAFQLAFEFGFV